MKLYLAYHTHTSFADLLLISTLSKLTNNDLGTKVADSVGSKFELAGVRSFEGGGVGDGNALILRVFSRILHTGMQS